MNSKEYTLPNGKKAVFEYDVCGIGKITLECMDELMGMIADRPQGEWIEDPINKNNMYCSNCKVSYTKDFLQGMSLYHEPKDMPNYCPNCGAKMKGADDEID